VHKIITGLALGLFAGASFAQSVIAFDVTFDKVYEGSGSFTPNITIIRPGPFSPGTPEGGIVNLTGRVVLSAVPSGTELTNINGAVSTITLNGSFSTQSGFSPSNGWSVHSFDNATFNLYKPASFFATDFVTNPNDWPLFTAAAANGKLSDHGPASIYGGNCPYVFGCASAQSAGSPGGTQPFDLFDAGTPVFAGGAAVFAPGFRNTGNFPLISGTATQTNPGSGLGFDNGMDAFALQGVLDVNNTQGNGGSQLYPDGVNGFPGIVRILTFSNTGNTLYMVEGRVTYAQVPVPATAWLLASALGVLAARRRASRRQNC
jgi:hypothetical protein